MRNNPAVTGLTHLEVGCNDERNETAFAEDEPSGKRKRFKELNELVAHPKPLVGDNPPPRLRWTTWKNEHGFIARRSKPIGMTGKQRQPPTGKFQTSCLSCSRLFLSCLRPLLRRCKVSVVTLFRFPNTT
jgi:hypothetical protein